MSSIDEWWPQLDVEIRHWMVDNFWSPVAAYSLEEITRLGGPAQDDPFWDYRDGEAYLPAEAVTWIIKSSDFELLRISKRPDPRAAYLCRGWPYHH